MTQSTMILREMKECRFDWFAFQVLQHEKRTGYGPYGTCIGTVDTLHLKGFGRTAEAAKQMARWKDEIITLPAIADDLDRP